jgi:GTP cyclohydrolase II
MKKKISSKRPAYSVRLAAEARLPTKYGSFRILGFEDRRKQWIVALLRGNISRARAPLVRIHSQCLTGDVFCSLRCDCRAQLEMALKAIAKESAGIVLYEPQEGRGIGLINKLRAYQWQDKGLDTVEANRRLGFAADRRNYRFVGTALKKLKVSKVRLLSNNPEKIAALEKAGIEVVERVPCQPTVRKQNRSYLKAKKKKLGHLLTV